METYIDSVEEAADAGASEPRKTPPQWQQSRVINRRDDGKGTVALRLKLEGLMEFIPGQYINLRRNIEGRPRPIQRSYSIGSSPYPVSDMVEVIITKVEGGLLSPMLTEEINVGDIIEARGPYGKFIWNEDTGAPLLMIAAGSGVVPFLSMIQYMEARALDMPATLLVSSQTHDHVIGKAIYERMQDKPGLRVIHTYTRSPDDERAQHHRRIDKDMLVEARAAEAKVIYICGPGGMIDAAKENLADLGVAPESIQVEAYP